MSKTKIAVELFDATDASYNDYFTVTGETLTIHCGYAPHWNDNNSTMLLHETVARGLLFSLADHVGSLEQLFETVAFLQWQEPYADSGRVPLADIEKCPEIGLLRMLKSMSVSYPILCEEDITPDEMASRLESLEFKVYVQSRNHVAAEFVPEWACGRYLLTANATWEKGMCSLSIDLETDHSLGDERDYRFTKNLLTWREE
jgi:hypothetical protein